MRPVLFTIISIAVISGCTMMDQDQYSGIYIESGVTPWEEKGPVQMCIGYHRIAPPGTDLGGFCQKRDNPNPETCTDDSQCDGRMACVCGVCTVKYCTRSDECPDNMQCDFNSKRCVISCESDCDCPGANPRCDLGMCQQMCIVDGECQLGELCSLSMARCITVPCSQDGDCYDDEECVIQMEPRIVKEPHMVIGNDGHIWMFVEMDQGSYERRVIFRARSTNGVNWEMFPAAPVIESGAADNYHTGSPTVVFNNGKYIMYYVVNDGEYIGRAESTDGRNWVRDPAPVLYPIDGVATINNPSAVVEPYSGLIRVYFESGDGRAIKAQQSIDADGKLFDDPDVNFNSRKTVVEPADLDDGILWRGLSRVRSPFLIVDYDDDGEPVFRLWVAAKGYESSEASSFGTTDQVRANYSVGYMVSRDGYQFVPYPFNPVYDTIAPNSFVNHLSELSPAVLDIGSTYLMFYAMSDADLTEYSNLGYAKNPPRHSFPSEL
ncbi:hypothetical protein KKF34_07870 [Myxococcota bacterium]|nr:hypothetical protein [Myxococcota bacterium]MBU1496777.1 hypothetical protein [Myxococcota bacterium]